MGAPTINTFQLAMPINLAIARPELANPRRTQPTLKKLKLNKYISFGSFS